MNLVKRSGEMRDFFNNVVDLDYDDKHSKMLVAKEKIVDFLPDDIENIIDLGAGTGLQLIKLYKVFPNVKTTAIDISDGMLKKLEERHISDNIIIINQSFFEYEFGKDIDAVISTQALHHFDPSDKEILYRKVYECLREHGVFVIEDYFAIDDDAERQGFEDYKNLVKGVDSHYDTPLTIPHEIEILKSAGFSSVEHFNGVNYNILISRK